MLVVTSTLGADEHDTGADHPERPERLGAALAGIDEAGLQDACLTLEPRRASYEELALVHSHDYLLYLRTVCEAGGGYLDADTPVSRGSWDTALLAAGSGLAAIDSLDSGSGTMAFVAVRPPGHHALGDTAMGFCLLNNISIAARALAERGERVAIVDYDVHHGNGTQAIFWNDPRVLYTSIHQWPLFPGTGRLEDTGGPDAPGTTLNIPLPPGTTGEIVLRALDEVIVPAVEHFAPTWLLVSAGFDGHRADPLADWRLSAGDFADIASRVTGLSPAPGRLLMFLEGGYDLDALCRSVGSTLAVVAGVRYRPESATSGGPGSSAVDAARNAMAASGVAG
ncbi:MAG: histone deacetylase family protein [Acidimicrobiales bacterium]